MSKLGLVVLGMILASCAAPEPSMREVAEAPEVFSSWEEGCEDARSVVLLCDEDGGDECGLFLCREVVFDEVLLASRGGPFSRPMVWPTVRRGRDGQLRGPRDAEPVLTFRFYRSFDPPPRQLPRFLRLATPEAIYRHAGELIFRFELTGPIVPYYSGRRR